MTSNGWYTARQIQVLGYKYKDLVQNNKGWMKKLVGKEITDSQARAFVLGKFITRKNSKGKKRKLPSFNKPVKPKKDKVRASKPIEDNVFFPRTILRKAKCKDL